MWWTAWSLLVACGGAAGPDPVIEAVAVSEAPESPIHTKTVLSPAYHIDKRYPSMTGPSSIDVVKLWEGETEILWITGYRTTVVDVGSGEPISQEWMCHANLDFDAKRYYEVFPKGPPISGRLFTLSQGQQEVLLPRGFGIPVTSDLEIKLATQVLNLNDDGQPKDVKYQVDVMFVRDSERMAPMIPLYQSALEGFVALEEAHYYGVKQDHANPDELGPGCEVGQAAIAGDGDVDAHGQRFSAHWVVPPGRQENRTNVTRFLNLPYDTRAHYIAVHLHPFAEYAELIDLTTGKSVFKSKVTPAKGRVGIDRVESLSSVEGIEFYADHEYELLSVYNNTSDIDADSMAVMYLYLRDKNYTPPQL